jgi:hypothetical protein
VALRAFGPIVAAACVFAGTSAGALADTPAGIGGVVVDGTSRQPVSASLTFRRGGSAAFSTTSNARGFFIALGLEPGRYSVTATAAGRTATCDLEVDGGEIHRYRLTLAADARRAECEAPARYGLVDPDQSGNLYRI